MNKIMYKKPLAETVRFTNEDVITTSWFYDSSNCDGRVGELKENTCRYAGGLAHLKNLWAVKCSTWNGDDGTWTVKAGHEWGKDAICSFVLGSDDD